MGFQGAWYSFDMDKRWDDFDKVHSFRGFLDYLSNCLFNNPTLEKFQSVDWSSAYLRVKDFHILKNQFWIAFYVNKYSSY